MLTWRGAGRVGAGYGGAGSSVPAWRPLTSHLLHDALLVVVAQRAAQLVVVHGGPVLLQTPAPGHLLGLDQLELEATARPRDARGRSGIVQHGHQELPQLQRAPALRPGRALALAATRSRRPRDRGRGTARAARAARAIPGRSSGAGGRRPRRRRFPFAVCRKQVKIRGAIIVLLLPRLHISFTLNFNLFIVFRLITVGCPEASKC